MKNFFFGLKMIVSAILMAYGIWMHIVWIPTPTAGALAVYFVAIMFAWWSWEQWNDKI